MGVLTFRLVVPANASWSALPPPARQRVVVRELVAGVSLICSGCGHDSAPLCQAEVNDLLRCNGKDTGWLCNRCAQRAMRGAYVPHACA